MTVSDTLLGKRIEVLPLEEGASANPITGTRGVTALAGHIVAVRLG